MVYESVWHGLVRPNVMNERECGLWRTTVKLSDGADGGNVGSDGWWQWRQRYGVTKVCSVEFNWQQYDYNGNVGNGKV